MVDKQAISKLNAKLKELYKDAQTGRVLIVCALLEDILMTTINTKMVPLSSDIESRIFGGNGPLQNISSRIDIAYSLGFLDGRMRRNLHLVRKIRNGFAHTSDKVTFDSEKVVTLCKQITPEVASNDPQTLFFDTIMATMSHLLAEAKKTNEALREKLRLKSLPRNPAPGQTEKEE